MRNEAKQQKREAGKKRFFAVLFLIFAIVALGAAIYFLRQNFLSTSYNFFDDKFAFFTKSNFLLAGTIIGLIILALGILWIMTGDKEITGLGIAAIIIGGLIMLICYWFFLEGANKLICYILPLVFLVLAVPPIKFFAYHRKNSSYDYNKSAKEIDIYSERFLQCMNECSIIKAESNNYIIPIFEKCRVLLEALKEEYGNLLDPRDWENLDFIIFYYETNRVDTIREALLLADNERRADRIVQAVNHAGKAICSNINAGFKSLQQSMDRSFAALSNKIGALSSETRNLVDAAQMNNALLAKSNESSRQLADDLHQPTVLEENYMRKF